MSNNLPPAFPRTWCAFRWVSKTSTTSFGISTRPCTLRGKNERRGRQHVTRGWHALRHHGPAAPTHSAGLPAHRHGGPFGQPLSTQPFRRVIYAGGRLPDLPREPARKGDPGPAVLCIAGRSPEAG